MIAKRKRLHTQTILAYRMPMTIHELYILKNGNAYYLCPRCYVTLEREFAAYCDRCGQCLNWSQYENAKPVSMPGK